MSDGASRSSASTDRRRTIIPKTLDEFINHGEQELWPDGVSGFRLLRGRVVWTTAHYPDGSDGNWVCVSRIVHEHGETFTRIAWYDRDTKIEFVK